MSNAGKLVGSGSWLTTGGALATASVLALSFVAAPPHVNAAKPGLRQVQLASLTLPTVTPWSAILDRPISRQGSPIPDAQAANGPADFARPTSAGPLTYVAAVPSTKSATSPTIGTSAVSNTISLAGPGVSVLGTILAAGAFILLFGVLIPLAFINGFIGYNLIDPILSRFGSLVPFAAPIATAAVNPTVASTAESGPVLTASAPASNGTAAETAVDRAPVTTGKRGRAERAAAVVNQPTGTEASTGDSAEKPVVAESTGGAATSTPVKPTGRASTSRPMERKSLDVTMPMHKTMHRGSGGNHSESSSAASPSTHSESSSGDSSGDDADGS